MLSCSPGCAGSIPEVDPCVLSAGPRPIAQTRHYQRDHWERAHLAGISEVYGISLRAVSAPEEKAAAAARALADSWTETGPLYIDAIGVICRYPEAAAPPLLAMLSDADCHHRQAAITALSGLGEPVEPKAKIRSALVSLARRDPDPQVRDQARAFGSFSCWGDQDTPTAAEAVEWLSTEPDRKVRGTIVLFVLSDRRGEATEVVPAVLRSGADRASIRAALTGYFIASNLRLFEEALRSGSPEARAAIGSTLWGSSTTGPWAERLFLDGLLDQDPDVRSEFHRARDHFRPLSPAGRRRLRDAAQGHPDPAVRSLGANVLEGA